ncbi:hypothetical protein LUZ60_007632 [Juncus effusus]|nr:hypothetical protein LUZ60_007632 [Juncus effusus]
MKQNKPSSLSVLYIFIHPPFPFLTNPILSLSRLASNLQPAKSRKREGREKMTRKRVRIEKIAHEPTRLATFKKRKACIMKKAHELSVLCSIPVYVEVSDGPNSTTEVWPQSEKEASEIINRFESMTESEKTKKMVDKEGFVSQQILKKQMQLQKVLCECQDLEDRVLLRNLLAGKCSIGDLRDREVVVRIQSLLETQMGEIQKRKEQQVSVCSPVPVQSDAGCGTISMMAILPVREKNFTPLIDGSFEKEGFFDLLLLEGQEEIQMPPLAAKSDDIFKSLPDWRSVEKEISESLNKSHEKDPIFESISAVVASEENNKLLAAREYSDNIEG